MISENRQSQIESAAGRLLDLANRYELTDEAARVADRMRDSSLGLVVLVTGEGKFGKSSLINALAGTMVAPVSVVPKTFKVDLFVPSDNGKEYAMIRRAGVESVDRVAVDRARAISDAEEASMTAALKRKEPARSSLLEIAWHRSGLATGPAVCIADTPGLAQMLDGRGPISESLVSGLGAKYYVDEVWSLWYHRADVVLWCFQANKMESDETHRTLTTLTRRFQKQVIPVATKCDLIPRERWPEISKRFRSLYGGLPSIGTAPMFLTVTSDKSDLNGQGVGELREHLKALAPEARSRKLAATEQSTVDGARHVEGILDSGGKRLVENLRTIADTADEIALEAMRQVRVSIESCRKLAEDFATQKKETVHERLGEVADTVARMEDRKESPYVIKQKVQDEVFRFLDLPDLSRQIRENLDGAGKDIERFARTICSTRQLQQVSISVAGTETTQSFALQLEVPLSQVELQLNVKTPDFSTPGWLKAFEGWGDWAEKVGKWFREFVGMTAAARVRSMAPQVQAELDSKSHEAEELCRDYLSEYVAKALNDSMQDAFESATNTRLTELFTSLGALDQDVMQLRVLQRTNDPATTSFEHWARYWTSTSPPVDVVRKLVASLVLPKLEEVRTFIRAFRHRGGIQIVNFGGFYGQTTRGAIRPVPASTSQVRRWIQRVCGLGLPECKIQRAFSTSAALKHLQGASVLVDSQLKPQPVSDVVKAGFDGWLQGEPITAGVDAEASENIPNASFQGFASAFRQQTGQIFEDLFEESLEQPREKSAITEITVFTAGPVRFSGLIPPVAIATSALVAGMLGGAGIAMLTCVATAAISIGLPPLHLRLSTQSRMRQLIADASNRTAGRTAEKVSTDLLEQTIDQIAVELSPRPLQRALNRMTE